VSRERSESGAFFSAALDFCFLLHIHAQLDAWYGMAMAIQKHNLVFPGFIASEQPFIEVSGLYHPLLSHAVSYDVNMNRQTNFLFLTGANMAGKSTFIKAVGISVYLAHLGYGCSGKKNGAEFI
jgi:DNA mismatch repair protein MutS